MLLLLRNPWTWVVLLALALLGLVLLHFRPLSAGVGKLSPRRTKEVEASVRVDTAQSRQLTQQAAAAHATAAPAAAQARAATRQAIHLHAQSHATLTTLPDSLALHRADSVLAAFAF